MEAISGMRTEIVASSERSRRLNCEKAKIWGFRFIENNNKRANQMAKKKKSLEFKCVAWVDLLM